MSSGPAFEGWEIIAIFVGCFVYCAFVVEGVVRGMVAVMDQSSYRNGSPDGKRRERGGKRRKEEGKRRSGKRGIRRKATKKFEII